MKAVLEEVPRVHGRALYRFAFRLTGSRADAQDLVQNTYLRMLRRGAADVPPERMLGWLFTVARNLFIDASRGRRWGAGERLATETVAGDEVSSAVDEEGPTPWQQLDMTDLQRAVAQLRPALAIVYRLHAFEGLRYTAIAARLLIRVATVGSRM